MDPFIEPPEVQRPMRLDRLNLSDLRIALQSALAAGICLGLPTGLYFGVLIIQRKWWWVSLAALAGVRAGHYALYHGLLEQGVQDHVLSRLALHVQFGIILTMTVLSVTVSMGLLLGLVLMNWRAALALAGSTGLIAAVVALVTLIILDGLGIRVGSGNAAMPKATATATMAAALAGGAVLAVMFRRYLRAGGSKPQAGQV